MGIPGNGQKWVLARRPVGQIIPAPIPGGAEILAVLVGSIAGTVVILGIEKSPGHGFIDTINQIILADLCG